MKLTYGLKKTLLLTLLVIYGSGVGTWVLSNWFQKMGTMGLETSPYRVWWLEAHSVSSLWFIGLFGYLIHSHVLVAWRRCKKVRSGLGLTLSFLLMFATVPVLFYANSDRWRESAAWFHTYFGLALIFPFLLHYFLPTRD